MRYLYILVATYICKEIVNLSTKFHYYKITFFKVCGKSIILLLKVSTSTVLVDATYDYCESDFGELRNFKPLHLLM